MSWAEYKRGLLDYGRCISAIVNTAALLFVYVFGVGPTSIMSRLLGKRFLQTGKKKTYWTDFKASDPRRQF